MTELLKKFCQKEDGAVTVDWVVLTAAIVGLATVAYVSIETNTSTLFNATAGAIGGQNDF
ncbi:MULTISPECIES: Flp family type IVb pilin [unclassified Marinovum]